MTSRIQLIPLAVLILASAACIPKKPRGAGGVTASAEGTADGSKCGADGVVDDGEDNNNQSAAQKGRGGYWYTFADNEGSTITPTAGAKGGTFNMSAGGANGSAFAARINGQLAKGQTIYAGAGVNFVDPKGPYDASAYKGISFWAKKGEGSTGRVRLKLPDVNTDQEGKVCTECFNDFGADIELTSTWTRYTVAFASMRQETGWGNPRPAALESAKVFGVQWQVRSQGESFDIWIDDVEFTGCP